MIISGSSFYNASTPQANSPMFEARSRSPRRSHSPAPRTAAEAQQKFRTVKDDYTRVANEITRYQQHYNTSYVPPDLSYNSRKLADKWRRAEEAVKDFQQ